MDCIDNNAANCGYPKFNSLIQIVDYDDELPTEQGTIIHLTCPPHTIFSGPNFITCMENGQWEPDPSSVQCIKGKP